MALLTAPSKAVQQILTALNIPPDAQAFTLTVRAGEPVMLVIETYVDNGCAEGLAEVFKHYRLQEIEKPAATDGANNGAPRG